MSISESIAVLQRVLQADGADLTVVEHEGQDVRLALSVIDASCMDCVMPKEFIERIALDAIRKAHPQVARVTIEDPRESSSATT